MERLKRRRDGLRRVIHNLTKEIDEFITTATEENETEIDSNTREKISASKNLIKEKEAEIKELQEEIYDNLDKDDEFDQELDEATEFELEIRRLEERIKSTLTSTQPQTRKNLTDESNEKTSVRLPRLEIKKFGGEPTEWQQFYETFNSAIHNNNKISDIEKFTYLKGYLSNEAATAINGFSLTSKNYNKALELLKERFGNEKLIVSTHMHNLLRIKPVTRDRDVKGLRILYDSIETQARSLQSLGIDSKNYGALLAPVIMEKVPHFIRLIINRTVKEWDLELMLNVLREELQARENCGNGEKEREHSTIKQEEQQQQHRKNFINYSIRENSQPHTASNLLVGTPNCVFCKGQHFSDKCSVITDLDGRRNFLRKGGRCFLCLQSGHIFRECTRKKVCFYCKKHTHHSAICDSARTSANFCEFLVGNVLSKETPIMCHNSSCREKTPSTPTEKRDIPHNETPNMNESSHNAINTLFSTHKETRNARTNSPSNLKKGFPKDVNKALAQRNASSEAKRDFPTNKNNSRSNPKKDFPSNVNKPAHLLQTAEAFTSLRNGTQAKVRLLLDSGSQRTYVSRTLVNKLELKPTSTESLCLSTFGNEPTRPKKFDVFEFAISSTKTNEPIKLKAVAMNHICNPITDQEIIWSVEHYEHLKNLELADSGSGVLEIDILVGTDHYWEIITGETIRSQIGPTAVNSKLGWILSGPTSKSPNHSAVNNVHTMKVNLHNQTDCLDEIVKRFWDLETLGIKETETDVIDEIVQKITLNEEGRYEVSLPFKETSPIIPDNFKTSKQRLMSLLRNLKKNPEKLQSYDKIMKEQFAQGIIEPANEPAAPGQVHYLPHHGVVRDDKNTTKLRIVYDASSSSSPKTPSLNDCLYKGPQLNPLLYEVLMLFRTFPVALTSDIEKAFHQISVTPSERDYLRFLWFDDVFSEQPKIIRNRFARLIFGVSSSPFLLTGTMRKHLSTYNDIDPEFVRKVTDAFHVDDFTSGETNIEQALTLYKKLKLRFAEANFNLRKWRTNDTKLRELIESNEGTRKTMNCYFTSVTM